MAINARFQMKRDTLANWNASSIVLKPGELAVAYVDVATTDPKGNIIHVPTALLKTGENVENSTKTFKDLPFISALAADVYPWAKKDGIEVVDTETGNVVSDVEWDKTNNRLVIHRTTAVTPTEQANALKDYYNSIEGSEAIAVSKGTSPTGRTATVTLKLDNTHGNVTFAQTGTGLSGSVDLSDYALKDDIPTELGVMSVKATGDAEITMTPATAANGAVTVTAAHAAHAAGNAGTASTAKVEGYSATGTIKIPKITTNAAGHVTAINEETVTIKMPDAQTIPDISITEREAVDPSNNDEYTVVSGLTESGHSIAVDQVKLPTKKYVDGKFDEAKGAADAAQGTADEVKEKLETFLGSITPDDSKDIIDTLQEINDYVGEHGEEFATLSGRVTNIENGTTVVPEATHAVNADNATNAGHAGTAGTAANSSQFQGHNLDEFVLKTEAAGWNDILTKTAASSTYVQVGVYNTLSGFVSTIIGNDANKSMRQVAEAVVAAAAGNYATKEQGEKADSAVQEITTGSANGTISVDGEDVAVKGLGSAAYTASTAYATSAQGAKADTAVQDVTSIAEGIKVTATGTTRTIEWDGVLVFDCGTATTVI